MIGADLRASRRDRAFDAMDAAGIDVLVAGRRDDVAELTGADGLWTAGTRPFGAACVAVAANRAVHLLSTWDAGVPPEVPFERLYGVTWSPATMREALAAIPGFAEAGVVGVDALSPGFARAVARLAPGAEVRPADDLLRAARRVKLPAEIELVAAAVEVSSVGMQAAVDALAAGGRQDRALGAALEAMAGRGATVPAGAPVVGVAADGPAWRCHVDLGVLVEGYEGGSGRTFTRPGPGRRPAPRPSDAHSELVDACRAGVGAEDLRAAAAPAASWLVRGCGAGYEPPVVDAHLGSGEVLEAGMVLSVATTDHRDVPTRQRDVLVVRDGPPRVF